MFAVVSDTFSNQDHTSCDDINLSHSLLSMDNPDLCLQCAYDWSDQILQPDPKSWAYKQQNPLEGLEARYPIFDFQARMAANMSSDASYSGHMPAYDALMNDLEKCLRRHQLSLFSDPVSDNYDYQLQNTDTLTYRDNYSSNSDVSDSCSEDSVMPEWHSLVSELHRNKHSSSFPDASETTDSLEPVQVSTYFPFVRPVEVLFDNSSAMTDSSSQFAMNYMDDSISSQSTAVESKRIDLVGELPSHEEVIAELAQALRVDPNSKYDTNQYQDAQNTLPSRQHTFHTSDSRNSLWLADMSSASSPDFTDRNTDDWLSENDYLSTNMPTTSTNRLGSIGENLMHFRDSLWSFRSPGTLVDDTNDEDGGCPL
ncbi:hypothetical protein N7493_007649 [Penicillium malachiteum]|uniref:Uncharacterized protein n=1 Tax=Penicillium malachiteum TaxID=1324776 RepID=A0AAD6HI62_9EURO|nr:hypothetical protein N7493_007649 [Penicillium malachiteum]